jgi:putative ABC transport system permease protein
VAVFVAIRLANRAAVSSFTHFSDTLTGQSDLIVQASAGTLPESVLGELRAALGARPVHIVPVLEATAAQAQALSEAAGFGRMTYTLLGVDLLALANLASQGNIERGYFDQRHYAGGRGARGDQTDGADFWQAYAAGPQVWVSAAFLPKVPDSLDLVIDERVRTLRVAGVIPAVKDAPRAPALRQRRAVLRVKVVDEGGRGGDGRGRRAAGGTEQERQEKQRLRGLGRRG